MYGNGSILAPHVDQLPRVLSAVLNVASPGSQTMAHRALPSRRDREDREGREEFASVTMEPGDLLLYESASIIGRPSPLEGDMYANIFIGTPAQVSRCGSAIV